MSRIAAQLAQGLTAQYQPLCPGLYNLLRERYGDVQLAMPGEAFQANAYRDSVTNRVKYAINSPGEYYRINCPFCRDQRKRLWINHMYGQFDADGRRITHLAHCYNDNCLSKYENRKALEDRLFGLVNRDMRGQMTAFTVLPGSIEPTELRQAQPPGVLVPVNDLPLQHKAQQYLQQRRYTPTLCQKYRISYCVTAAQQYFAAADRLVFPIFFDNQLVGWQCRYIGDINWAQAGIPKYYTMPGFHKRLCLYNYDTAKHKPFVVIVEGLTDVHAVGDNSVALLGKTMSHRQQLLLLQLPPQTPFVVLLDADAQTESDAIADVLATAAGSHPVVQVQLPGDLDPADYDRPTLWNIIQAQAASRGVLINFAA
jgi:hypothetical protein